MAVEYTFGRGAKEIGPGLFEVRDGMEVMRTDPSDQVWWSWEVKDSIGIMSIHVNPKPEEIQAHWMKPEKAHPLDDSER